MQHRTHYSAEFKTKVALAAISGLKTLSELASEYKVHPTQINRWKQELIENATGIFGKGKRKEALGVSGLTSPNYSRILNDATHPNVIGS